MSLGTSTPASRQHSFALSGERPCASWNAVLVVPEFRAFAASSASSRRAGAVEGSA